MKYCKNCGAEIDENAIFCSHCGSRINGDGPKINFENFGGGYNPYGGGFNTFGGYNYPPYYDTQPSKFIAVVSFIFWQVGLIIWFFCRHTRPGKARSAAKGALSSACVAMPIIGAVLWILWKDDISKQDYAKVSAISALVGVGIYVLLIVASIFLTLTGAVNQEWYLSLPTTDMATILSSFNIFR